MTASSDYESPSAPSPTAESDGFEPYDIDRFWPNMSSVEQGHIIEPAPAPVSHPAMPDSPPSVVAEEPRVLCGKWMKSMLQAYTPASHRQRLGSESPAPTVIRPDHAIPDDPRHRWGGNDTVWS